MHVNTKIENLAQRIVEKANIRKGNYGFDPITVIIVIGVILSLIRVIQECRSKRKKGDKLSEAVDLKNTVIDLSIKDNWLNNYRLNRILKQHLSKQQFKQYGDSLRKAIMEVGKNLDIEESLTLLEAIKV